MPSKTTPSKGKAIPTGKATPTKTTPTGKATPTSSKKKKEEEKEVWRWWEEAPLPDGVKWLTLEHKVTYLHVYCTCIMLY